MLLPLLIAGLTAVPGAQLAPGANYKFSCDYIYLDTRGTMLRRERVLGHISATKNSLTWRDVSISRANGKDAFGIPEPQAFMDGFHYSRPEPKMFSAEFFKSFPAGAINMENLVWDTAMFENFSGKLGKLTPGEVFDDKSSDAPLAGAGNFHNADIQLTMLGHGPKNGHDCSIIKYLALFNGIDMSMPSMALFGRSNYWGEIWLRGGQLEYGTLYEDVLGELSLKDPASKQVINVFRIGTLEREP